MKKLKGENRPIQLENEQAEILSSLEFVDHVLIFPELTVEKCLKNQQDSDVLFASGQKTANIRLGNQVFDVNDRGLFYLINNTIGYDPYFGIFGVYPTSQLIELLGIVKRIQNTLGPDYKRIKPTAHSPKEKDKESESASEPQ